MKLKYILFFILLTITLHPEDMRQINLMPVPANIEWKNGHFNITNGFNLTVQGNPHKRIYPAATRMLRRLSGRTGLFFPQDYITEKTKSDSASIIVNIERPGKVDVNMDETYELIITSDGIKLNAATDIGAIRGFETLLQLLESTNQGYHFPNVVIKDKPRFRWRGLMMDVCRHWMPMDVVKRNIDGMAAVKMNIFHIHLSEDQGFRIESKTFPKLHELGSDGFYFTQEEIKEIIRYCDDRGIRVVPEFDIPGHSTSWFTAFPELSSAPGPYTVERRWGVLDPVFDPTNEETYKFFDKFFAEICALFPDEYFHIGGDENNGKHWKANEKIQKYMQENNIPDNHALQTYFNQRILEILTKYNKKMVGWDEILHPGMPKNIVIQSWRGRKSLYQSATEGYTGILSNGYYIDLIQSAEFHYLNDPVPPDTSLPESTLKNIWGGEATSWAELVTPENIDSRIWPRTAAIAERLWSPQNIRNVDDIYRRMDIIALQLEELGLLHLKNQDMMLRRLIQGRDITALKTLINVVEPVKIYTRHNQGVKYTSYSPYTRFVDAALPESHLARDFRIKVKNYIDKKDKTSEEFIIGLLKSWSDNHTRFINTINNSPVLFEVQKLSENLRDLSLAGIEAMQMIKEGKKADPEWLKEKMSILEGSKKPYGQSELVVTAGFEILFKAL